jgi:hypothetical protein
MPTANPDIVTPGLDPGVHLLRRVMDGRVKPGHDLVGT